MHANGLLHKIKSTQVQLYLGPIRIATELAELHEMCCCIVIVAVFESTAQLVEIRKFKYAKVICENADYMPKIQPSVFHHPYSVFSNIVKLVKITNGHKFPRLLKASLTEAIGRNSPPQKKTKAISTFRSFRGYITVCNR